MYLSSLRPIIFVSHIPVICLRTHRVCTHTLAKMDLEVKASGRSKAHYGLELSSDFWPQRAFLCLCSVLPNPLLRQGFASHCPCQDYSLEVFTRDKDWLLTLFLLLLQFLRANRGLVVNSSTGTHLSVASGNAEKRLADCEFPTWNPSISYFTGSLNSENKNEIRIFLNTIYKNKLQIR